MMGSKMHSSLNIKNTDTNQERFRIEAGSAYVK